MRWGLLSGMADWMTEEGFPAPPRRHARLCWVQEWPSRGEDRRRL